jgi:hypothetical protein
VPVGTSSSPGITPDGSVKGNDVVNTFGYLDAQTFTLLAMANSSQYRMAIDWRQPVKWMISNFAQSITAANLAFQGFDLVSVPVSGPNGIAWEFTGQAVVSMRFVDALYHRQQFEATAASYMSQIANAQATAPFGDTQSLAASTMQNGDTIVPYQQCLVTPFQCVAERPGMAATAWAIFADLNVNPFEQ